jgi:putative ABC transport system permease protein
VNTTIEVIPITNLALSFLPALIVIGVMFSWSLNAWRSIYALCRMLVQLVLIGYVLIFVFTVESPWIVSGILMLMMIAASWISLGPIQEQRIALYPRVFLSLSVGCGLTFLVVTQGVLALDPWFTPNFVIPLAGMIFANSMNTVSLAAERYETELKHGANTDDARKIALQTGLIPVINSLFAVGLVSLPGMMTGQILSGISPLVAVRYQIMVMCMMFGASGISTICYLLLKGRTEVAVT